MIVGIVGSRDFTDYKLFEQKVLSLNLMITGVVSGGCRGADKLAEQFAKKHKLPITIHAADWDKLGSKAGPIRNSLIVKDSDRLIAFVSKSSVGTFDTINKATKKKIPVDIFNI